MDVLHTFMDVLHTFMDDSHTFMDDSHALVDVSANSSMPITHNPDENFDEGVLIPHNALYNNIHPKILTLRRTTETALEPRFAVLLRDNTFYEHIIFRRGLCVTPNNPPAYRPDNGPFYSAKSFLSKHQCFP